MDGATIGPAGRIGPNAVTRMAEALAAALGPGRMRGLFERAGIAEYLATPPGGMVPERDVTALHRVVRAELGEARAAAVAREAGRRTAEYLLAHRIPGPVQWLLRLLPAWPAARLLLASIGRHAWTFAGSGRFRVLPGRPIRFEIAEGPIARGAVAASPVCAYYAATFETLFQALVSPRTEVEETACMACGAPACTFEARW